MATSQNPSIGKDSSGSRKFLSQDFPYIRKAVIALAGALLASAAMMGSSSYILTQQKKAKNQAQAQNSQSRERYAQTEKENQEIHEFQPKYLQMLENGLVGNEQRLHWIEKIKTIQKQRGLLAITYEIFPQQIFQLDPAVQTGELELRGSRMRLSMDMLHELDLFSFLEDLKQGEPNQPVECAIKPVQALARDALAPRLSAECTLYWITLGPRAVADGTKPGGQQ